MQDGQTGEMTAALFAGVNINPATGLATDYLNHFNEAIMLLEAAANCLDCLADFHAWRRLSYCEHFRISRLKDRNLIVAAYASADPAARACLDRLAATMTTVIEQTRACMTDDLAPRAAVELAERAAAWLKVLVTRAGNAINGTAELAGPEAPQAAIDRLMRHAVSMD